MDNSLLMSFARLKSQLIRFSFLWLLYHKPGDLEQLNFIIS